MSSGYVSIEWIYGDEDDEWEPVATLEYWEISAIKDALRSLSLDRKMTADYWKRRDPDNRGTEVAVEAAESASNALRIFERVLKKMRDKRKESDGNATD